MEMEGFYIHLWLVNHPLSRMHVRAHEHVEQKLVALLKQMGAKEDDNPSHGDERMDPLPVNARPKNLVTQWRSVEMSLTDQQQTIENVHLKRMAAAHVQMVAVQKPLLRSTPIFKVQLRAKSSRAVAERGKRIKVSLGHPSTSYEDPALSKYASCSRKVVYTCFIPNFVRQQRQCAAPSNTHGRLLILLGPVQTS